MFIDTESASPLFTVLPEVLLRAVLVASDARTLARLDCTGHAFHGWASSVNRVGSSSLICMAVRASASERYPSVPLGVALGRRGWPCVLRFAEQSHAQREAWQLDGDKTLAARMSSVADGMGGVEDARECVGAMLQWMGSDSVDVTMAAVAAQVAHDVRQGDKNISPWWLW